MGSVLCESMSSKLTSEEARSEGKGGSYTIFKEKNIDMRAIYNV
jgi:hypothetical protein